MAVNIRVRDTSTLKIREGVVLLGDYNGLNVAFTTPETFVQTTNLNISVYRNGQRLRSGPSHDYVAVESGGPGTGYDTVQVALAPHSEEILTADYRIP